jgi:hypothetical protein
MKVTINITNEQINTLKYFLSKRNEDGKVNEESNQLAELLKSIESGKEIATTYEELSEENKRLNGIIAGLMFQIGMREVLLSAHGNAMGAAVADLFINPNPVEIHGTEAGKGYNCMVSLKNVLLIESNKRIKTIYLKEAVIPIEGGKKRLKIENNETFEENLNKLQRNGHHILRVSTSYAINIYHYELSQTETFVLISPAPEDFIKHFGTIEIDNKFDSELYHTRLMEIARLNKHHQEFSVSLRKIEEINRYKK